MAIKKVEIKTAGELREFLVNMLFGVKDGVVSVDKASVITKMAGQINESIYAEIKATRLSMDAERKYEDLGNLNIGVKNVE